MVQGSVRAHQGCMLGTGWGADTTAARWRGDWGAPVSTMALAPQSHPFPPTKAKGWDAAGGKWQGGKGKGEGGQLHLPLAPDTTQSDPKVWEVPPLKPGMCGCGGAWHK